MNKTVEEWAEWAQRYQDNGDDMVDAIVSTDLTPLIDHARETHDYPLENEGARLALENAALMGLHLQALVQLVVGMAPLEQAQHSVHELTHLVWRQVATYQTVGNLIRSALVEIHHAVTGDPLPPTDNPEGEVDFEFWAFQRELNGQEATIQAALKEILDGVAGLKTLAGIDPA